MTKAFKLKFSDPEFAAAPHKAFDRLRARGDVFQGRMPIIGNTWFATSYAAVTEVFRDQDLFARDPRNAGKSSHFSMQWMMPTMFRRLTSNMISRDGADHRRLRSLADSAFQRSNVEALRDRMKVIAEEQLTAAWQLAQKNGSNEIDLMEQFTRRFPLAVICELLGLPEEDHERFTKWFAGLSNISGTLGIIFGMLGIRKGYKYIQQQIREQRTAPRDGLIAELIQAEESGERLSTEELESTVLLLLLAGHETTVHLIGVSILTLLQMPDARKRFLASEENATKTVHELLRHGSVAQYGKPRWVTRDVSFHSVDLKRGEAIMPVVATANYDPAVFENPHEFDIGRANNNRHLTFGTGPHICIGLKLAEAETEIALRELFTRYPAIQLAFDIENPAWGKRMGMRSLKELRVQL